MTARPSVSQLFVTQFCAAIGTVDHGRMKGLARLVLGLTLVGSIRLQRLADAVATCEPACRAASLERQFRRWLSNERVVCEPVWATVAPLLLQPWAGQALVLVFDTTRLGKDWTVLTLGVAAGERVLPLALLVRPSDRPWGETTAEALRPTVHRIAATRPPETRVTLVADQGLTGPDLIDLCRSVGWSYTLRVNATAAPETRVRTPDGWEGPIRTFFPRPGQLQVVPGAIYRAAGWRDGWLTGYRGRGYPDQWILFSDAPGGAERLAEYRQRALIEATFADFKTRGWEVETTRVRDPARIERLLLALALAYWWLHGLGRQVVRRGRRRRFDRAARRTVSLVKLGRAWLHERLRHQRLAAWFARTRDGWRALTQLPGAHAPPKSVR